MKTIFYFIALFVGLFFFNDHLIAQNSELEYLFSSEDYMELNAAVVNEGRVYAAQSISVCGGMVVSLDPNNENEPGFIQTFYEGVEEVTSLVFREVDSTLISCSKWRDGDDLVFSRGIRVRGLEAESGEVNFDSYLPDSLYQDFIENASNPPQIALLPNNQIGLISKDYLVWLDENGQYLQQKHYDLGGEFLGLQLLQDTLLVMSTFSEAVITNLQGDVLYQVSSNTEILDMTVVEDNVLLLRPGNLLVYNTSDQNQQVYDGFLNPGDLFHRIETNADNVFLYETHSDFAPQEVIQLSGSTYELEGSFVFDRLRTKIKNIVADDTHLYLIGEQKASVESNQWSRQGFIKSVPIFEDPAFLGPDLEFSDLTLLEGPEIVDTMIYNQNDTIYDLSGCAIVEYTVTNNSAQPVQNYTIASQLLGQFNCLRERNHKYINGLNLQQGQSLTLLDTVCVGAYGIGPNETITVSLTITAPNHYFDRTPEDNHKEVIAITTSTEEVYFNASNPLRVFPNPANAVLNIQSERLVSGNQFTIQIFDVLGRVHKTEKRNLKGGLFQTVMDISELTPGQYWLKFTSDEGVFTRSFIRR